MLGYLSDLVPASEPSPGSNAPKGPPARAANKTPAEVALIPVFRVPSQQTGSSE